MTRFDVLDFLNKLIKTSFTENTEIKKLLEEMKKLGPKIVVITDGPKGAYAYDGSDILFMQPYPDPKPPYERTGAGDAFSSTTTVALALGKNLSEAFGIISSLKNILPPSASG